MKKAVLVGINYRGQPHELRGCINDMIGVRDYLLGRGYTPDNIRLLTDDAAEKPTLKNINTAIDWLKDGAKAGDTLMFYYSGHGSRVEDTSGDEASKLDDVIIPVDTAGVITDDDFRLKLVDAIPAGVHLWAFFDCCHSGTMFDLKYNATSEATPKKANTRPKVYVDTEWTDSFKLDIHKNRATSASVVMFSGCLDPQTAADAVIKGKSQGAFTFCLLECLSKKQTGRLLRDLLKDVNCLLKIQGYNQRSQLSFGKIEDMNKPLNI